MDEKIRSRLISRRDGWLEKCKRTATGDRGVISTRLHEITMDKFTGDPNSFRTCAGCGQHGPGWMDLADDAPFTCYHICEACGAISECRPRPEQDILVYEATH